MPGWVERVDNAFKEKKENDNRQKEEDAKALAVRVSLLLGETIEPGSWNSREAVSLDVSEGNTVCTFLFVDEKKQDLALSYRCKFCDELFLVPVQSRAALGEIFDNFHGGHPPKHESCLKNNALKSGFLGMTSQ